MAKNYRRRAVPRSIEVPNDVADTLRLYANIHSMSEADVIRESLKYFDTFVGLLVAGTKGRLTKPNGETYEFEVKVK